MYFTIENPDIKLMEELEYSKRVAEKSKSETINTLNNIKNELDEPLNQIVNFNDKKIIYTIRQLLYWLYQVLIFCSIIYLLSILLCQKPLSYRAASLNLHITDIVLTHLL